MAEPDPPSRLRFFRFGVPDFVFIFFALGILQRAHAGMLDDPGLGWQIRIPDAMVEQGGFLHTDPFGGPTHGQPWMPYGFLGSAAFRLAELWSDLPGIAVLTVLTLALILRLLYGWMVRDGVPPIQAVGWVFLAALGMSTSWVARPNLFTLLLMPVVARTCVQYHRGRLSRRQTLWLLPMFTIWVNTHGGFAGGFITIAVAGVVELATIFLDPPKQDEARARFRWLVVLGVGCLLASFVNPYGWNLHRQLLRLMGDKYIMGLNDDWLSPNFHDTGAFRFELLILLLPLFLAASKRRIDWLSLALAVVWLHFALNGRRYVPIWALITVPSLAILAKDIPPVQRAGAWFDRFQPATDSAISPTPGRPGWFWTAAFAVGLMVASKAVGMNAGHNPEIIPADSLDRLLAIHRDESTFHSINWGGYLTWKGWEKSPRFLTWIDDRNEIHGRERTEEWRTISATLPGWRERLRAIGVELVCVEADSGLAGRLPEEADWQELYRDKYAAIFRRKSPTEGSSR